MKNRIYDFCGKTIEGKYIKCCLSEMVDMKQKLTYVGDLCEECFDSHNQSKGGSKNGLSSRK